MSFANSIKLNFTLRFSPNTKYLCVTRGTGTQLMSNDLYKVAAPPNSSVAPNLKFSSSDESSSRGNPDSFPRTGSNLIQSGEIDLSL
jgi:hypothetical protein